MSINYTILKMGTKFILRSILKETKIEVTTLSDVLRNHLFENQHVDFFTIDTEGLEFEICRKKKFIHFRKTKLLNWSLEQIEPQFSN